MSNRGFNPKDYEYDGNDALDQESLANSASAARATRFKATTVVTTAVLAAAGLVGGAAFAMNEAPQLSGNTNPAVVVSDPSATANNVVTAPSDSPVPTPTADDTSAAAPAVTSGKTIAVPPAAFDDKKGERDFHTAPAAGSANGSTSGSAPDPTSGATAPAPSFGGGSGSDDNGGEHHHRKPPTTGTTAPPLFNNSDDGGSDD